MNKKERDTYIIREDDKAFGWLVVAAAVLSALFLWMAFSGCYTRKLAEKQMQKAHDTYEIVAAGKCAFWYPFKPTTVTHKSDTVTKHDTVQGPTIYVDCPDGSKQKVDCPPTVNETNYVHDTTETFVLDSAAMRVMQMKMDSAFKEAQKATAAEQKAKDALIKAQNKLAKSESQKWWTWGILIALGLGAIAFKFFKPKL